MSWKRWQLVNLKAMSLSSTIGKRVSRPSARFMRRLLNVTGSRVGRTGR